MTLRRWIAAVLLIVGVGLVYWSFHYTDFMGLTSEGIRRLVSGGVMIASGVLVLVVRRRRT